MSKSIGKLWTTPLQPQGQTIRAAAAYADLKVDLPENFVIRETNRSEEYIAKFPNGKIPAFETPDGFYVCESTAVARFVASHAPNSSLLGSSPQEAASVDQWISFVENEIRTPLGASVRLCTGALGYSPEIESHFREHALHSLDILEKWISTRTYLVGERPSLADFTAATALRGAYKHMLDPSWRKSHPNLQRYFETVINLPKVKGTYDPIAFCDHAAKYVKPEAAKKEEKPAKEAKKKDAPKKETPKKKAADDDDEEEEDEALKEPPKAKNPLDSLPKSGFNLEDWKRAYSNKDTRGAGGSIEWFYEKFDKEGFSVWRVDFKYNKELTQVFMSSNQIGGFFNRLEASRKYLFGSVGVLGTSNDSLISGVLICRGKDIKPVVDVAPDYESYEYKEIDLSDAKGKEFFEAALAWDLEVDGKKWADGKNFK